MPVSSCWSYQRTKNPNNLYSISQAAAKYTAWKPESLGSEPDLGAYFKTTTLYLDGQGQGQVLPVIPNTEKHRSFRWTGNPSACNMTAGGTSQRDTLGVCKVPVPSTEPEK